MNIAQSIKVTISKELIDSLTDIHTIIKAKIVKLDTVNGKCVVAPIPKREVKGQIMEYPYLIECDLDYNWFGNWKVYFPREIGDIVYIGFEETGEDEENIHERFSLNNPFVIRGVSSKKGGFTSKNSVTIEGNGTIIKLDNSGNIEITAGSNKTILNSDLEINGNLKVSGETTGTGEGTFNGIKVSNHKHGGVKGGSDLSGGPQ